MVNPKISRGFVKKNLHDISFQLIKNKEESCRHFDAYINTLYKLHQPVV